jgi:hypothetical protein
MGPASARLCAQEGATVFIAGRNQERGDALAQEIDDAGGNAHSSSSTSSTRTSGTPPSPGRRAGRRAARPARHRRLERPRPVPVPRGGHGGHRVHAIPAHARRIAARRRAGGCRHASARLVYLVALDAIAAGRPGLVNAALQVAVYDALWLGIPIALLVLAVRPGAAARYLAAATAWPATTSTASSSRARSRSASTSSRRGPPACSPDRPLLPLP